MVFIGLREGWLSKSSEYIQCAGKFRIAGAQAAEKAVEGDKQRTAVESRTRAFAKHAHVVVVLP